MNPRFGKEGVADMGDKKSFWRAFLDFFVLFSGVSTASNLSRTRTTPVRERGLFLFRKLEKAREGASSGEPLNPA
jgi:hypothetical protein